MIYAFRFLIFIVQPRTSSVGAKRAFTLFFVQLQALGARVHKSIADEGKKPPSSALVYNAFLCPASDARTSSHKPIAVKAKNRLLSARLMLFVWQTPYAFRIIAAEGIEPTTSRV